MSEKLNVIQIGTAHAHAAGATKTLRSLSSVFRIMAVGEPNVDQREALRCNPLYQGLRICSVEEALSIEGLDAAVIETAEEDLTRYAIQAAERGLHVQMDKPGGTDLREFEILIDLLRGKQLAFQPGYMYRFNPAIQKAVQLVEDGVIGRIISVEAHMSIHQGSGFNRSLDRFPGGMMFFLGCHLVDLLCRICGKPTEILPLNCSGDGSGSLNYGMAFYRYPNGVSFVKSTSTEINGFLRRQLVITGQLGTVEIKPLELFIPEDTDFLTTSLRLSLKQNEKSPNFDCSQVLEFPRFKRYDDMFLHFARMVRGETGCTVDYDYELSVYRMLLQSCGVEVSDRKESFHTQET